ncbi:AhpC/TSA family protein [Chitinophaga agrisoli]|uniref:AhpC/TSA family protein n=1 Tax=Chitinophaga agrisoli TaxID=2607653 RepID=A0A5B2W4T0_9BACT|nr:TlpA disulfide reductase family protein [Chitinophaga agrisoli]KAA2245219.1 AhpC/TSA family protein [Chitinophaga agrisoli]
MRATSILLVTVLFCRAGCLLAQTAPKPFVIEGTLNGGNPDSVRFSYTGAGDQRMETAVPVIGQRFTIKGETDGPGTASLMFVHKGQQMAKDHVQSGKDYKFLFIEPGTMQITGTPAQLEALKLTGSKTQAEFEALNGIVDPIIEEGATLRAAYKKATDIEEKKALNEKMGTLEAQRYGKTYDFMLAHPQSYVTEYYLNFYMPFYSVDSIKKIYTQFSPAQRQDRLGKSIGSILRGMEAGSPGQMATDFKTMDINGKSISLSDFKGKYVILDFWASWCVPCRHSHPHLIQWYNKYKGKGLEIIGIASDDGREAAWKKAIEQDGIGIWHHALAGVDQEKAMKGQESPNDITAKYGVTALPTKLIIDPSGKIVARDVGDGEQIGKELEKIFEH